MIGHVSEDEDSPMAPKIFKKKTIPEPEPEPEPEIEGPTHVHEHHFEVRSLWMRVRRVGCKSVREYFLFAKICISSFGWHAVFPH